MHIIRSVLHTVSLTDFQLCKQGAGVHVTAGSSGPPLSPSLPLSLSPSSCRICSSSNITTLHCQTQRHHMVARGNKRHKQKNEKYEFSSISELQFNLRAFPSLVQSHFSRWCCTIWMWEILAQFLSLPKSRPYQFLIWLPTYHFTVKIKLLFQQSI